MRSHVAHSLTRLRCKRLQYWVASERVIAVSRPLSTVTNLIRVVLCQYFRMPVWDRIALRHHDNHIPLPVFFMFLFQCESFNGPALRQQARVRIYHGSCTIERAKNTHQRLGQCNSLLACLCLCAYTCGEEWIHPKQEWTASLPSGPRWVDFLGPCIQMGWGLG